jgi:sodium pump decarboxylase gamma subunit
MEILIKGTELMIVGMGMTFCFLILLVFTMKLLEKFIAVLDKISPEQTPAQPAPAAAPAGNAKIAAAIAAAKHYSK